MTATTLLEALPGPLLLVVLATTLTAEAALLAGVLVPGTALALGAGTLAVPLGLPPPLVCGAAATGAVAGGGRPAGAVRGRPVGVGDRLGDDAGRARAPRRGGRPGRRRAGARGAGTRRGRGGRRDGGAAVATAPADESAARRRSTR